MATPTTLDGTRLFARIRALDFECPRCGRLESITSQHRPKGYDARSGRYRCPTCNLSVLFGVLIYPVTAGRTTHRTIPDDWIPTARQAAALRQLQIGIQLTDRHRRSATPAPRNARGPACLCQLDSPASDLVRNHPACPIHRAGPGTAQPPRPHLSANTPDPRPLRAQMDQGFDLGAFDLPAGSDDAAS